MSQVAFVSIVSEAQFNNLPTRSQNAQLSGSIIISRIYYEPNAQYNCCPIQRKMSYIQKDHPHSPPPPQLPPLTTHKQPCTVTLLTKSKPSTLAPPTFRGEGGWKKKTNNTNILQFSHSCNPQYSVVCATTKRISICFTEHNFFSALNKARPQSACLDEKTEKRTTALV